MKEWIHKKETERLDLLRLVASQARLPDFMIEKDFWVTATLECIFTCALEPYFAFKGGTSLSKSWNLLNRFSEDIDIVIDKTLFGIKDDEQIGRSQRGKLRKNAHNFILETVTPQLNERMLALGIPEGTFKIYADQSTSSDQDPTVLLLDYRALTEFRNNYTKPQVKIEIGVRALMEPSEKKPIRSLLAQHLNIVEFAEINTVLPQRAFWEKVFLLHELFRQPLVQMDITRMSRHWYDLHQLINGGFAVLAMQDKSLFEAIRSHRKIFTKVAGIDYDKLTPKLFVLIPPDDKANDWQNDYAKMVESYIYRDAPTLQDLTASVHKILNQFTKLEY